MPPAFTRAAAMQRRAGIVALRYGAIYKEWPGRMSRVSKSDNDEAIPTQGLADGSRKARPARRHHHHVYVVELADQVWNEASFRRANPCHRLGKPFVYVGMTGLDPDLRFDKHKAGIQANRFVFKYGLRLLPGTGHWATTCRPPWMQASHSRSELAILNGAVWDIGCHGSAEGGRGSVGRERASVDLRQAPMSSGH